MIYLFFPDDLLFVPFTPLGVAGVDLLLPAIIHSFVSDVAL
jgi:hypothetical protein